MKPARLLPLAALNLPLVGATALAVALDSHEGRADSYVAASLLVSLGCAVVELAPKPRAVIRVLWVAAMPFVAGASTGFMLALVHPKKEGLGALFGGAGIGLMGALLLFPVLGVAAGLVQAWTWWWARRRGG